MPSSATTLAAMRGLATVSMPLDWREVTEALDPARFTLRTAFRRLDRQKHDPLAGLARPFGGAAKG